MPPLPYLEATNSRINIKNGLEKLPFSLVNADLSFWQENPGDWRVRLRGQPARTDVSLDLADTGMVQLEASLPPLALLNSTRCRFTSTWSGVEAQLGQLSRLILGSDPGWRGDLTGEMHLDGTAEAAQVKTRLRATGVHRAEFAPAEPLDFDANCGFVYHYSARSVENLVCDSPLGDGRFRVLGDLPGNGPLRLSVELQRIPVQAGLDALRTMRNGLGEELEARGTVSGKLTYDPSAEQTGAPDPPPVRLGSSRAQPAKNHPTELGPLLGSLTVEGFQFSGDGLSQPIQIPKFSLQPETFPEGQAQALTATIPLPAGGAAPLAVKIRLALGGYQVTIRGPASLTRIREVAQVAGIADTAALDSFAGEPATLDLSAEGPWLPAPKSSFSEGAPKSPKSATGAVSGGLYAASDQLTGSVALREVNWKAGFLAGHLEISQATVHLSEDALLWDPVVFSYGPVKGTASLRIPSACESDEPCPPQLVVHFAELDTGKLQAALLGAQKPDTLLSTLISRLTPSQSPPIWPRIDGIMNADSLILGPVTLQDASATVHILPAEAKITSFDAGLLGGQIHATGRLANGDKPSYTLEGTFEKLAAAEVCRFLVLRCTGGAFDGTAKVELSGFTDKDLAASAKGTVHFEWLRGTVAGTEDDSVPPALARFRRWTADAAIANGAVTLQENRVQQGIRKSAVEASIAFGDPPKVTFAGSKPAQAAAKR